VLPGPHARPDPRGLHGVRRGRSPRHRPDLLGARGLRRARSALDAPHGEPGRAARLHHRADRTLAPAGPGAHRPRTAPPVPGGPPRPHAPLHRRPPSFHRAHMPAPTILWRRPRQAGHACARLVLHDAQWHLTGTAVFTEAGEPCRLDYRVVCDHAWRTLSGSVAGWWGDRAIGVEVRCDAERRWSLNDVPCLAVAGCLDIDLGFTPATNLLPIRRLGLPLPPSRASATRGAGPRNSARPGPAPPR